MSRGKNQASGWGVIIAGMALFAMALVGIFEVFGPVPAGYPLTLAVLGLPIGCVSIVIGIVLLVRRRLD